MTSEATEAPVAEIIPAKSEDKLEIEREEKEVEDQKKEEEGKKEEQEKEGSEDKPDAGEHSDEAKEKEKEAEGDKEAEGADDKTAAEAGQEKKKFSLPKVKPPKVLAELRAKSKERKKKKEEGDQAEKKDEGKEDADETKEAGEGEESAEKEEESTLAKVKGAIEGIKIHKPAFLKKKKQETTEKEEKDKENDDEKEDKKEDGEEEKDSEKEKKEEENKETESDDKVDAKDKMEVGDEATAEAEEAAETEQKKPSSIIDTIKGMKPPKVPALFKPKKKEAGSGGDEEAVDGGEQGEEEKKLLEKDDEEKKEDDKKEDKSKVDSFLTTIRNTASGLPSIFKKKSGEKEQDVELGEKEELLDKTGQEGDNQDSNKKEEEMVEISLEEKTAGVASDSDNKSQHSEKKDPEKGEEDAEDGRGSLKRCLTQRIEALDSQQRMALIGTFSGVLLIIVIILIAACSGSWQNHHRYVEGGKFIETMTGCGAVWGAVEGHNRFAFKSVPYSVQVDRFEHSRLPANLDECGDETKQLHSATTSCLRRTVNGMEGEEDCLYLDIYTPSVMYNSHLPVVVYLVGERGDGVRLQPTAELAYQEQVVFVNVNVRQGALGYLSHPAVSELRYPKWSGNYALGDLLTALKWVQLNVAHFGGNPGSVTLLGSGQGASLASAITTVEQANGLFHRIWATGGSASFSSLGLEAAATRWAAVVTSVCGANPTRACLVDVEPEELLEAVDQEDEIWSYDNLPKAGESQNPGLLTIDNHLLKQDVLATWAENKGPGVPFILGANRRSEGGWSLATSLAWNDSNVFNQSIESKLGSWNLQLPGQAIKRYKSADNWDAYSKMVTDIRTVCPLAALADNYSLPLYVSEHPGNAHSSTQGSADLVAIFGGYKEDTYDDEAFVYNVQKLFFNYVKMGKYASGRRSISATVTRMDAMDDCKFWQENGVVPNHAITF